MTTLRFNEHTADYVFIPTSPEMVAKAEDVGLDLSTVAKGKNGEPVYFTKEPYAILSFVDHGDDAVRNRLQFLLKDYSESWALDADLKIPLGVVAANKGWDYLPFQRGGVGYATRRRHTLIADEMGLGKTVQAIGYANLIGAERILVVCPASIRINWKRKIEEWSTIPRLSARAMLNSRSGAGLNPDLNYLILSYELASVEAIHDALCASRWDLMIFDEAHYLKTRDSRRTQAIFGGGRGRFRARNLAQQAEHLLPLTGTPLPNRPRECYTIARALCHEAIDWRTYDQFCYRFNPSAKGITDTGKIFVREEKGRLNELQARLRCNFMVRRLKKDVLKDLPDVRYEICYMEQDGSIKDILRRERMLDFKLDDLKNPFADIWGQISTIRREFGEACLPQFIRHAKMLLDVMEVPKLPVFFHHRGVMDAFREEMKDYGVVEVRGGVSPENKQKAVDEFIANPRTRIFSGQLQAAGFGIDGLQQVASTVVIFEPDWVPGNNAQIIDRLHRMGQHDNVVAQLCAVEGSILDRILGTAIDKMHGIHQSLDEREAIEANALRTAHDVAKLLEIM